MKNRFTKVLAKASALVALCLVLVSAPALAQEEDSRFSMDVTLNSDIFFGFYPFFAGSYSLNEKTAFTFYGILWSGANDGAGFGGGAWGNWTEFGVGMNFDVADGININPQIGLLSGSLTSGLGTPVLGEGIVPNLTMGLDKAKAEGEIYIGYYHGFNHGNPTTFNYLHYWANTGYKFTPFFSAGLHLEHLRFTGGSNLPSDASYDYYVALGPYVQFADPNGGAFARFTSGADLRSDEQVIKSTRKQPSFFKLTVGYSF